jgi:hypothetical protein
VQVVAINFRRLAVVLPTNFFARLVRAAWKNGLGTFSGGADAKLDNGGFFVFAGNRA